MVNSIFSVVQNLVDRDLSLQDALQRGYGNYSAIARMLKPKVVEALGRDVKLESVITSVKRAKVSYTSLKEGVTRVVAESTISIRTDVAKVTIKKTDATLKTIRKDLSKFLGEFLHVLEGVSVTTLILDQRLFEEVYYMFQNEDILYKRQNLAAIVVQSSGDIIDMPGCITTFYNQIARRHISIQETVSCYTDTIIVLDMDDVGTAFTALTDLVTEARNAIKK
jgi:hypothetical protein